MVSRGLDIDAFVLYAQRGIFIGRASIVRRGAIGVRSKAEHRFGIQLKIRSDSHIERSEGVFSPSILLERDVECGSIATDLLDDDGVLIRSVNPFPVMSMPPLPLVAASIAPGATVNVPASTVTRLNPGSYGDVSVSGRLVLTTGHYSCSTLTLHDDAELIASGGTVSLMVGDYFAAGRRVTIYPESDKPAERFKILVAGPTNTETAPGFSVGEHSMLKALVAVPHGSLALADHLRATGAFAAFDLILGEHVEVDFESGFTKRDSTGGSQQLHGYYGTTDPATVPLAGPVPPGTQVTLAVGLPITNPSGLASFISQVSDPASSSYRQYLTQADFYAQYGASAADYANLQAWATSSGFAIKQTYPNNLLLSVTGTAAQVEAAFFTNLVYRLRSDDSKFIAVDREPSLNLSVPILAISGLNNYVVSQPVKQGGSGGNGSYRAADLRNAYLGVGSAYQGLDGYEQVVGIVAIAPPVMTDIQQYNDLQVSAKGQPPRPPTLNVQLAFQDSCVFNPGDQEEATLDVELVSAMAPRADFLIFQGCRSTANIDDVLHAMATSATPLTVASCSLITGTTANTQQALDELAAQGTSFLAASGDYGYAAANYGGPNTLTLNNITLVGGTILSTSGLTPTGAYNVPYYVSETAWPCSGGGVLAAPIPSYQVGLSMSANGGSTVNRNYPDVAMPAQGIEIYSGGNTVSTDTGTSFACPLFAGFIALANQQSKQNGFGPAGFLNPNLYDIGETRGTSADIYATSFNDIADGSGNRCNYNVTTGFFKTVPGYDLVTGWGSPKPGLIDQLGPAYLPNVPFTWIEFIIRTGGDDLGGGKNGSSATADVFLNGGGKFTVTLKQLSDPKWPNGSTTTKQFPLPPSVTPPLTTANGIAGVQLNLIQNNPPYAADNWDVSCLGVTLFNPGLPHICQLNLAGTATLQDGSIGLVRLSLTAGSSGNGPTSQLFTTGTSSGCQSPLWWG